MATPAIYKEQIGITDQSALTQWVNTTAKGYYSVRFEEGAQTAYISSSKEMVLPKPNSSMTIRDAIRMRGFALHETSHPRYQADAFEILKANPMPMESPLFGILNMFLDVHAETSRGEEFAGDKKALSEFGAVLAADVADDLIPALKGGVDDTAVKMLGLMKASLDAESTWNLGMRSGFKPLWDAIPQASRDLAADIEDKFNLTEIITDTSTTSQEIWDLAKNVFTYVFKMPPETQIKPKGKGEVCEDGEPGDGDDGEGEGKGEGEGESKDGEGESDGDEVSDKDGKPKTYQKGDGKGKIKVSRMVWSSHYEGSGKGMGGHGKSMDFTGYKETASYTPVPEPDHIVKDYDTEPVRSYPHAGLPYPEKNSAPGFVSELRRLIQVESEAHYSQGYRSGKLSTSRLWRVGAPPIDEGRWNASVFKRKTEVSDVLDSCVSLVVDGSGSMSGHKFEQAYKAAEMLNDTMSRVLRLPVEINIFTSHGDTPCLGVVKRFDRAATPNQIHDRFVDFLWEMSGNNDADSLSYIYNRLKMRREKRKIMIVFSDGSPADGHGDPHYALRTVVKEIEAAGIVDIYGIGIMTDVVKRFYSQNDVIHRATDIQRALIGVLKKAMHKSK